MAAKKKTYSTVAERDKKSRDKRILGKAPAGFKKTKTAAKKKKATKKKNG